MWWSCDEVAMKFVKMCWRIVHKLWFISCDEIVVMKYSMKYVMKYSMKFCHYNCCDEELFHRCVEDVLKMCWMKREMNVEDVLKNCWRIVEDLYHNLHQACNVCMNFIRSFLKNNSMKMWSVILHIWNEVMNNPSLNMLWWSIYHLNFVIKSLWMFVMKYITHLNICECLWWNI